MIGILILLGSLLGPQGTAWAHPQVRPTLFALTPGDFPSGSHILWAGIASNQLLLHDNVHRFGPHPRRLGRLTGYAMEAEQQPAGSAAPLPLTTAPIFHLRTQDDLHRLAGWAQFGDRRQQHHRMLFALFASRYSPDDLAGMPWNVAAFSDFRGALMAGGFDELERVPRLLPKGEVGNSSAQLARSADGDVLAMACWTESIEVEGMALYAHGSKVDRQAALRYLTRQMRAAVSKV